MISIHDAGELGIEIGMIVIFAWQRVDAYRARRRSHKTDTAVEAVKTDVAAVKTQADAVHTLVNSAMATQLRLTAQALRRVADLTKDDKDNGVADEAERLLASHMAKQNALDATLSEAGNPITKSGNN